MAAVPDHPPSCHFLHSRALPLDIVGKAHPDFRKQGRGGTRAASLPKGNLFWSADLHWLHAQRSLPCCSTVPHVGVTYVSSHCVSADIPLKRANSFHLLQRLIGLQWEHKPHLQSEKVILKSTSTICVGNCAHKLLARP